MSDVAVRRTRRRALALLAPAGILFAMLFVYPMGYLVVESFSTPEGFGWGNYARIFQSSAYLNVFGISFQISLLVTVATLLVGYPLAFIAARSGKRMRILILISVMAPFFISLLVRTFAWMVVLGPSGPVNGLLGLVGIDPVEFLYNRGAVVFGMVYALLPYMVVTLFSTMLTIDPRLDPAARSLGASPLRSFFTVFLPLSMPGVAGAVILVFLLSLGFFITPRLVGGASDMMVSTLINWVVESAGGGYQLGAALSVLMLLITIVLFAVFARLVGIRRLIEGMTR
jgi:putative spermidine/putrescine transport system permease protein